MIKKYGPAALGVGVTIVFLALALRKVSIAELGQAAARLQWRWLPAMCAAVLVDLLVRSLRWRLLLRGAAAAGGGRAGAPLGVLFRLEAIGLALNNVLLMRLGEFTRAYLAGVELEISGVHALATVFVERALDTMALLALFVFAAGLIPDAVPASLRGLAGLGIVALLAALVGVSWLDGALEAGGAAWLRRLPQRAQAVARKAALGSRALRSWDAALGCAALSLSLWLVDATVYWMTSRAMGLVPAIGYGRSLVVLSTAAAASAIPAAPGAFGTFEQFVKTLLVRWQVAEPAALAYAGIVHLVFYSVVTTTGLACLYRMGHSFASLSKAARESAT